MGTGPLQFTYDLDIPPGIVTDDTTFARKGRWAACDNIRFHNGRPQSLPGFATLHTGFSGQVPTSFGVVGSRIIMGMQGKLYSTNLSALTDITPVGGAGASATFWSITNWGTSTVYASPSGGKLYESNGTAAATQVTNSPARIGRMLVTPQRQVLAFATDEVVSGTYNTQCIRGSDLEDPNDWTPSASNNSFEDVIDDPTGIVTAELFGQFVAFWTSSSVWLGQFVGDPGQTYRWDHVANVGLLNARAVTIHNGIAYWVGTDLNLYRWVLGGMPELLPCPVSRELSENYADSGFMVALARFDEVWLHYQDARDSVGSASYATRYIAYSIAENCWFLGNRTLDAGYSSPELSALLRSGGVYDTGAYVTAEAQGIFIEGTGTPDRASYIQTADQYLDSGRRRVNVMRMVPDFEEQSGFMDLTLYVRSHPNASPTTKGPYTFGASDSKTDFRASGMLMSVRFDGNAGIVWRLGKPTFDCVLGGAR